MPARNSTKIWEAPGYYHVYNRGASKARIYEDSADKQHFLDLLERYTKPPSEREEADREYPYYPVEVLAYCLMGNHFHLFLYQEEDDLSISDLMRSLSTAYAMYHHKRHQSSGHVFQGVFKAAHITNEAHREHITRYIHANPRTFMTYKWSSLQSYLGGKSDLPVNHRRVCDMTPTQYEAFLLDYKNQGESERHMLQMLVAA